jgi:putative membrane protein
MSFPTLATVVGSRRRAHLWRGALAGLVGGLVAAGAMSLAHKGLATLTDSDGTEPPAEQDDDATVKTADAVLRRLGGRPLTREQKPLAGTLVHYAFGGSVGALYGGVVELAPHARTGLGLPFGLAVWLGAHVITVPALGLAEPPTRRPLSKEAPELVLHLVYGAVTELVRRLLRGRP